MISGNILRAMVCPKIFEEELIKTTRKSIVGCKYPSDESEQVSSQTRSETTNVTPYVFTQLQDCNTL
jgi:hypothetical protein